MRWLLILVIPSLAFLSCKKDETKSKETLLTQKKWHATQVRKRTSRYHVLEDFVPLGACSLDNTFNFNTGGSYVVEDGSTSCASPGPVDPETGTWRLVDADIDLLIDINGPPGTSTRECNIERLDEDMLVYTYYSPTEIIYYQCTFSH